MVKKISADVDELATMLSSSSSASSPSLQAEFDVMEVGWVTDAVGLAITTDTSGCDDDDGDENDDGSGCWKLWVDVTTTWWVSIADVDPGSGDGRRLV